MSQSIAPKNGLKALLTPERCGEVLGLLDHQPCQFANLHSHQRTMIVNNVALAKTAEIFNVPTILTTVIKDRGGTGVAFACELHLLAQNAGAGV